MTTLQTMTKKISGLPRNRTTRWPVLAVWFGGVVLLGAAEIEQFYTPPEASWAEAIQGPVVNLRIPAGSVDVATQQIEKARSENPSSHLLIEPDGPLTVDSTPLRLNSQMTLRLSPAAGIRAKPGATASCLVEVEKAENVGISGSSAGAGVLDGEGAALVGIRVVESARVVIDQIEVRRCARGGITLSGRAPDQFMEACSLTRSRLAENGGGLRVEQSAGFMCLDNRFENQTGPALSIQSTCSVVAGNVFQGNELAIENGSENGVVTRNLINDKLALRLQPESLALLISENWSSSSGLELQIGGRDNQLFKNSLPGQLLWLPGVGDVYMVSNKGLVPPAAAAHLHYFNPPTAADPHTDPLIVPGMERFDFSIEGGKPQSVEYTDAKGKVRKKGIKAVPVDISVVQLALDQAAKEHPQAVRVLHLDGEFISRTPGGLVLPPHTCVVLQGRILGDLGQPMEPQPDRDAPLNQVILMPKKGFASLSGGVIDGGRQVFIPVNAATNSSMLIEGVTLTGGARDGLHTKGRSATTPIFVYRCQADGNRARGIWSHVASRVHAIANTASGNRMDGIDLDAHSNGSTALFNICNGNARHGIFIEEAIKRHVVFGNICNGNGFSGIHVWNEEVVGNTGANVIAANRCDANFRGLSVGAAKPSISAHENLIFNNVCRSNRELGIRAGNSNGKNNLFSQNIAFANGKNDVENPASAKSHFFNIPREIPR